MDYDAIFKSFRAHKPDPDPHLKPKPNLKAKAELTEGGGCPNCSQTRMVIIDGMNVCAGCGVEVSAVLDYGLETRFYGGEDSKFKSDPDRCGSVIDPLLPTLSYRTFVQGGGREAFRMYHKFCSVDYKDLRFVEIFGQIDGFVSMSKFSYGVYLTARQIYKDIYGQVLIRGKNVDGQLAVISYYAAKECEQTVTVKDVIRLYNAYKKETTPKSFKALTKADFSKANKLFARIYFSIDSKNAILLKPPSVEDYICCFARTVSRKSPEIAAIHDEIVQKSLKIVSFTQAFGITTKFTPITTAPGVLFYCITEKTKITRDQFSELIDGNVSATIIGRISNIFAKIKVCLDAL